MLISDKSNKQQGYVFKGNIKENMQPYENSSETSKNKLKKVAYCALILIRLLAYFVLENLPNIQNLDKN